MRLHDWMMRLDALVRSRQTTRFRFGRHDCSMWACDAVLAVTGRDPAYGIRGTYNTKAGAEKVIADGGGLERLASGRFGPQIKPISAAAGDIGITSTPRGEALVVCTGMSWLAAGPVGLVVVPHSSIRAAWRCEVA